VLGLAVFVWAAIVLGRQDVDATGAVGIDTGYDGAVVHVEPRSAAEAAGLRRGDVVDFASAHAMTTHGDLGRAAVAPAHVALPLGTVVNLTLHPAGRAPPRRIGVMVKPATSPSLSEQLLRLAVAALMLTFCAVLLWRRSTPAAFAAFAFALGANPFTFYVQLVPLPSVPVWCANVALIDLLVAVAFGAIVLLALTFPPLRYGETGWELSSGLRPWHLWVAVSVVLLSFVFQLGLDLPPILAGARTGRLFSFDLAFDACVAAFGFAALAYRWFAAKDTEHAGVLLWTLVAYTLALGGLIIQVYLTYAPPSEAGVTIAKRLSMSGLFMALVVGTAIVRDRGLTHRIRAHFVKSAVSATVFVVLPPLEERGSDIIHKLHAPPGGEDSGFSLATAGAIAIAYAATAIHHLIERWKEKPEHPDEERRPAVPAELVDLDGTPYCVELLRSFRTRFAAGNAAHDAEHALPAPSRHDGLRRVAVGVADGTPEGGAIFEAHDGWGFIELLAVARDRRDTDLGSRIVAHVERALREDADARGRPFAGLLATASDPFHRPADADRAEPFEHVAWLGRLGFARVKPPYPEPAPPGATAAGTILIARPAPTGAGRAAALRLEPLAHYAGFPDPALHFAPIDLGDDAQFEHFAKLYTDVLPPSASAVTPQGFRRYVLEEFPRIRPRRAYRLIGFGGEPKKPDGFLSYFTLNGCGF
ncbi:MAG TPA: hypothetical protein VN224_07480, partial [Xanthomonadales bacterium]|nr:hypothetical protein [Xanthomonadales bacterium]